MAVSESPSTRRTCARSRAPVSFRWPFRRFSHRITPPARYGAAPHPRLGDVDPARDAAELALIDAARRRRLPILAICRGIQILNVALGGTLYQDLDSERPGSVP